MKSNILSQVFNNCNIRQRAMDGYISATDMCKAFGKLFGNYKRMNHTVEFLEALSKSINISEDYLLDIRQGGIPSEQGTWVHPNVAVNLAQWLDPMFTIHVCKWISWYVNGDILMIDELHINNENTTCNKVNSVTLAAGSEYPTTTNQLIDVGHQNTKLGWTYLIAAGSYTKIGYTYNLPRRIQSLQTANPMQLHIIHTIMSHRCQFIEKELHQMFVTQREHGEWYRLTQTDIDIIIFIYS